MPSRNLPSRSLSDCCGLAFFMMVRLGAGDGGNVADQADHPALPASGVQVSRRRTRIGIQSAS